MKKIITIFAPLLLFFSHSFGVPTPNLGPRPHPYDKHAYQGNYGIWYRTNEAHGDTIKKPLLIVSGFDPSGMMRIAEDEMPGDANGYNGKLRLVYLYDIANKYSFLDKLRARGYDIIAYRCVNSTASIIDNGKTLIDFIKNEVADSLPHDAQMVVVGASMGGLLARYALTSLEHEGFDHCTSLFISLDSPQEGANIPLGFQHMVASMSGYFKAEALKTGIESLDCPAAAEMLLYHHSGTSGGVAKPAAVRRRFLDTLAAKGNFPKKCISLAISMGSGAGLGQGFSGGQSLIKVDRAHIGFGLVAEAFLPEKDILSPIQLFLVLDVRAMPYPNKQSTVYHEGLTVELNINPISFFTSAFFITLYTIHNKNFTVTGVGTPIDNAPGSRKGMHNLKDFDFNADKIFEAFPFLSKDNSYDNFIPSYSALGLRALAAEPHVGISRRLRELNWATPLNGYLYQKNAAGISNFDFMYIENKNLDHIFDAEANSVLTEGMLEAIDMLLPITLSKTSAPTLYKPSERLQLQAVGSTLPQSAAAVLQVSADDEHGWRVMVQALPLNDSLSLSFPYEEIVRLAGVPFADWVDKPIKFRIQKTIKGNVYNGNTVEGIRFTPPDYIYNPATKIQRSACDNISVFDVHFSDNKNVRYVNLPATSGGRYSWVLAGALDTVLCEAEAVSETLARYTPHAQPVNVFEQGADQQWTLGLRDNATGELYCKQTITIPRRPATITVAQRAPQYTVNGQLYSMPNTTEKFVMLDINDPDYGSHHRAPYKIVEAANPDKVVATIYEPVGATFDMLPPEHQAAFRQEFDNFYNQYLNNAAAKQDFFSMQQGTVLAEKVEQLAAPKDGSFMLYIQNSRLYKASLHGVRITATQELLPGTSVSSVEVSPDGAYCVYQKTGNTGLFYASVASPAEKRLSSKRTCIAANMEAPKRFAKNAAGNWEYVFLSGANIYSVQITAVGAKEWVFAANVQNPSATPCLQQAFADDNNDVHYLQFSGKYGSADLYKVLKKNIDSPNTPAISYRSFFMECGAEGCSEVSLHAVSSRKAVLRQKYGSRFNYFALGRNRMEHLTSAADFQFSINPFMASCILSGSGNTHINSTNPDSAIVNGRVATNIGYSTSGNIMLYMDKLTGRVYKSFINQAAAKAELEELYRRYRWEQWIAQQLGTRVLLPNNIALGVHQWQLLDADGCVAEVAISTTQSRMNKSVPVTLTVTLTAPPTPNISYTITAQPTTGSCGTARVSLVSGGTPPYRYGEQTLSQSGDQITVSNLQFGDNLLTFFDRDWNQSASINIHIAGKGVSTVAAAPQTSSQPNGSLSITTQGLSGSVAYTAELLSAPHTKYTRTIASSTCKIDGLPAGMYKVSVAQGGKTYSKNDGYEVASQIFSLKNIELMHAAKLSGTGSLRMEFANAAAGAACYLNGTNYAIKNGAVAANNLQAGKYAIRAVSGSSQLHDTVLVAAPEFWGTLRVSYRQNECRISTDEIFGNALFSGYEFRLKNENDSIVSSGKQLNLAVSSAQRYTLEVYNSVSNDAEKVGDIAPANAMQYRVSIAQPSCPYDSAAVGLAVQSGSFSTSSAGVEVSYNGGFDYGKVWKRTLAPSPSGRTEITALLRDSKVEQLGNLTLIRSLEQAVDTFFISPEEVIALPRREHVTCHGLSNGKIWLENLYGGSGSYRYKLNDGAWRSGSDTAFGLPPARYAVYLQDSKNLCRVVQLDSITVTEPEPLRIDSMLMLQPTCGYNNGLVAALVSGGNECYKAEWHYNGKPWSASNDDEDCTSNPYQVLSDSLDVGVYRVRVTDTYGCSATAEATLHEYRHSAITNFTVQNASCYNYDDGAIKFSVKEGDAPVKSIELWCADNLCGKTEGAKKAAFENLSAGTYRCVVRDTFGCTADTLVVVKQPDSLKIQAKVQPATIRYSVALSATGGSGSYAYRWSNGDTAAIVRSLPAGSYQVHVTDANRCAFETALELPKLSVDELIVYPNPTNGMLYIENHAAGDEVLLHDLVGALLLRSHSGVVDMSNLPAGLYLLRSKGKTVKVFKY